MKISNDDSEIFLDADEPLIKKSIEITIKKPRIKDGAKIWELIKNTGTLDLNSSYSYLMLCKYFSDTCVIAMMANNIYGFISSFILPREPNFLFVWQVAVSSDIRGKGLGKHMLKELIRRDCCKDISYIKTTITTSNMASRSLFLSFAKDLSANIKIVKGFGRDDFPDKFHEEEELFIIGPFVEMKNKEVS